MLPETITALEDVEEKYRVLYSEGDDGKYKLDSNLVDDSSKKKLNEFRTNNRALNAKLTELEKQVKQFDGLDLDEINTLLEKKSKLEDEELISRGDVDGLIKKKTAELQREHTKALKQQQATQQELEKQLQATTNQLGVYQIENEVEKAVAQFGRLKPAARADVMNRARADWKPGAEGPTTEALNTSGEVFTDTVEWAEHLFKTAGHLFEPGGGGGAVGNKKGSDNRTKTVSADPLAVGGNLQEIASGKATVEGFSE